MFVSAFAVLAAEVQLSRFPVPLPMPKRTLLLTLLPVIPWLVPVVLLCLQGGLAAALATGAFAAVSAKLFRQWGTPFDQGAAEIQSTRPSGFLLGFPEVAPTPIPLWRLTASVCLVYGGLAAALSRHNVAAVFCTVVGCFALSWMEIRYGPVPGRSLVAHVRSSLLHALGAVWVTFLVLLPHFRAFGIGSAAAQQSKVADDPLDQLHSGVILWMPHQEPVPLKLRRADSAQAPTRLRAPHVVTIPFSGEYWFYLWPMSRPPASSLREPGDPTTLHMTVHQPFGTLVMQAQQGIGTSLDIHCCHAVNVVVKGNDLEPEAVVMELILVDSSPTGRWTQSLGGQSLTSPQSVVGTFPDSRQSTFSFVIPARPGLRSFNEFLVWFHLVPPRSRRSATVSIERFDLMP